MANQSGISIIIRAFLPTGKTIDENFAAFGLVKTAHETGDYAALLDRSIDIEVKTEQKTRRIEDGPTPAEIAAATGAAAAEAAAADNHKRGFEAGYKGHVTSIDDNKIEAFRKGWFDGQAAAQFDAEAVAVEATAEPVTKGRKAKADAIQDAIGA